MKKTPAKRESAKENNKTLAYLSIVLLTARPRPPPPAPTPALASTLACTKLNPKTKYKEARSKCSDRGGGGDDLGMGREGGDVPLRYSTELTKMFNP